jgi:hypothetical protein
MVDLAIASNFARELTEEQFAQDRRRARRSAPAGRGSNAVQPMVRRADRAQASRRHDSVGSRDVGFGATRLGRTLARLAQVRG